MPVYSSDEAVIPTLKFTKAELVYIVQKLTADLSTRDNTTTLEMVELRHYCNLIKKDIDESAKKGELDIISKPKGSPFTKDPNSKPITFEQLQKEFPSLTAEEIRDILDTARQEQKKEKTSRKVQEPPKFYTKQEQTQTKEEKEKAENARKFESLLGGVFK